MKISQLEEEEFLELVRLMNEEAVNRYGSIKKALVASGADKTANQIYTNATIFEQLRKLEKDCGVVSAPLYKKSGLKPTTFTITNRFGSFNKACALAGVNFLQAETFRGKLGQRKVSDDKILGAIRESAARRNGEISLSEYKSSGILPNYITILKRFGSFFEACREAGVVYKADSPKKTDLEKFSRMLREIIESSGKVPRSGEYEAMKLRPRLTTLYNNGLKWEDAVKLAGYDYAASKEAGKPVPLKDRQ